MICRPSVCTCNITDPPHRVLLPRAGYLEVLTDLRISTYLCPNVFCGYGTEKLN